MNKWGVCAVVVLVAILCFGIAEKLEPSRIVSYRIDRVLFGDLPGLRGALELYYEKEGGYPDNLSELLPGNDNIGYLKRVPLDAWGNHYLYSKTSLGFQLYSVGVNGIDDNQLGDDVTGPEKKYKCVSYGKNCSKSFPELAKLVSVLAVFSVILFIFGYALYYLVNVLFKSKTHNQSL